MAKVGKVFQTNTFQSNTFQDEWGGADNVFQPNVFQNVFQDAFEPFVFQRSVFQFDVFDVISAVLKIVKAVPAGDWASRVTSV